MLLLEIGGDYCCAALLNHNEKSFHYIRYITYEEFEAEKSLVSFLEELNGSYERVVVASAFSQSLLVPEEFRNHPALLSAIYDIPQQKKFADDIFERQMNVAWSIPASLFHLITEKFSAAQFLHVYTPVLKTDNGFVEEDQIDIHFSTKHFRILVKKDRKIQLVQTYSYKTPLDVVYFLLKICYEFGLQQWEVVIIISGFIDEDSALYDELHNYFLNLHFANAPAFSVPESTCPHHYFTSLYNLAECVS